MNEFFVNSFQKVATFQKKGDNKQGGNVASYFCTPRGQVIHAIAGPVDAGMFLREARWAVELWKLAQLEGADKTKRLAIFMRKAHLDRLKQDYPGSSAQQVPGLAVQALIAPGRGRQLVQDLNTQGKIHLLLGNYPLPRVQQIYSLVFERILNERLSTVPVVQK